MLESLPERRTLDVACGTAFLSVHLRGPVAGVDQSPSMVALAAVRLRVAAVADALALPIAAGAVERVFTGHFYGHLPPAERGPFLDEARRVGGELVVVDTALRTGVPAEAWEERVLKDGSRHAVYKRFLTPEGLAAEIGGTVLFAGSWFVAARAAWGRPVPERPRRGAARQCTVTSATSASAIDTGTTTAPATL